MTLSQFKTQSELIMLTPNFSFRTQSQSSSHRQVDVHCSLSDPLAYDPFEWKVTAKEILISCVQPLEPFASVTFIESDSNGFTLHSYKIICPQQTTFNLANLIHWLRVTPMLEFNFAFRNPMEIPLKFSFSSMQIALGALISPSKFQIKLTFDRKENRHVEFARFHQYFSIDIEFQGHKFKFKNEHIDKRRGVLIRTTSNYIVLHVCLQGNPDIYNGDARVFNKQELWPSFSALRLLVNISNDQELQAVHHLFQRFLSFFNHHQVPIYFTNNIEIVVNSLNISNGPICSYYGWHMLASVGTRLHQQMLSGSQFNKQMKVFEDEELVYYVCSKLRRLALKQYFVNLTEKLSSIVQHYENFYADCFIRQFEDSWEDYVRLPWFRITPSSIQTKPYKFMRSNRVFRYLQEKTGDVSKAVAFVEFRDNAGSAYLQGLSSFLDYYLDKGFHFNGRHYQYLHHAQSQVRHKQFYFLCEETAGMTLHEIYTWMGNFDQERIPAKNTARMTQPFSSTQATIEIPDELVGEIPDVKTRDGKYNFTDGVGRISARLSEKIYPSLGVGARTVYRSSVLQIRYAGCKGVCAVDPALDGKKKQLLIRPSMRKFESNHRMLEVCKRSYPRNLSLNREVINLLSYRGISDARFLTYQLMNILWLVKSLFTTRSALKVIKEKVLRVLPLVELARHPNLSREPFFHRILLASINNTLHHLRSRAHIRVIQGRYLFGVVDEYGLLEEGQVFVQVSNIEDNSKQLIRGPVAITKNPCHHPGDLRVFQAVNHPHYKLHNTDCIIFPQKGNRPHPSEISGSDLDGDEYTLIFDSRLVPSTTPNAAPFDYDSGVEPKRLDRVVTRDDRRQVILDICEQDTLGRLSNLHLVYVDKLGMNHPKSKYLAGNISQELDSIKSGHHPYTEQQIRQLAQRIGSNRPDFMESSTQESYQSDKVLGKLYRSVRRVIDNFKSTPFIPVEVDECLLHAGYQFYVDDATDLYNMYKNELVEVMESYGFDNEIDLFCCAESVEMSTNDRSDIQQNTQRLINSLNEKIRQEFYSDIESDKEAQAKASACYFVAYQDISVNRILSFPWLFAEHLLFAYASPSTDDNDIIQQASFNYSHNPELSRTALHLTTKLRRAIPIQNDGQCSREYTFLELIEQCLDRAANKNDEQVADLAEQSICVLLQFAQDQ